MTKTGQAIAISMLLLHLSAGAQDMKYISLSEAVELATKHNSNIRITEFDQKVAHMNYRQTDAIFLPRIDLGYTALNTNNPLNAFGFLLQHQSVTTMDFDPVNLNNPGATQDYSATVEAKLPLFNLDMIYARKGAKAQEELYRYKSERTKEHIEFEVKKAYTQLQFSYHTQDILKGSLEDVKRIYQSVSNFYDQGLIQKSDVLNAQVQVNTIESALAKAESNIYNASDGLRLLIGNTQESEVYLATPLQQKRTLVQTGILSATRADIMALRKALDASQMMIKSSQMAYLPRINAFGTYQLNDSKVFGFDADSYLIGLKVSWNVFSGNENRSKIKSHRFQRDKIQEELHLYVQQSQLELNKTARELRDLQVEINKQELSVGQASEALRILTNRYNEGLISTTDLLMGQAQLAQQRLLLAQAITTYNITQAYLEFLSETE